MNLTEFEKTLDIKTLKCQWCNFPVLRYTQDKNGTQIYDGNKPWGLRFYGNKFMTNGKETLGMQVPCPRCNQATFLADPPEAIEEQIRLQYNFGKICEYHHKNPHPPCDRRQPCEMCIVYKNAKGVKNVS